MLLIIGTPPALLAARLIRIIARHPVALAIALGWLAHTAACQYFMAHPHNGHPGTRLRPALRPRPRRERTTAHPAPLVDARTTNNPNNPANPVNCPASRPVSRPVPKEKK